LSYVDAHIHLADPGYSGRIGQVVEDATQNEVAFLLSNAVDQETSIQTLSIARQYHTRVLAAIGVHPWTIVNSKEWNPEEFETLITQNRDIVAAIGEIGLDGKYTQTSEQTKQQKETFEFFLGLAQRKQLPVIVHSRQAEDEVLETLDRFNLPKVLLHWYAGSPERLEMIGERGYMISIGPSVLYSKRTMEIARRAPIHMILTETDGPVSYHGPFEGKMTQPSFVIEVIRKLAEIKSEDISTIRRVVSDNFKKLVIGNN
jgi:TatD DNase family protein